MTTGSSETLYNTAPPKSLGVLSELPAPADTDNWRHDLVVSSGAVAPMARSLVAKYLRGGSVTFASMEHTVDVIAQSFGVPGGSGIRTDGFYYWRCDAADYVEAYGVGVPEDFLRHCEDRAWCAAQLDAAGFLRADAQIAALIGLQDLW